VQRERSLVPLICFFLAILVLSGLSLRQLTLGPGGNARNAALSVTIEHFGMDAAAMERTIAIPLEQAVSQVPDVEEVMTVSQFSKVRLNLTLHPQADTDQAYLSLRDAVDRLYATLPRSVQRPRIFSSSRTDRPIFIVVAESPALDLVETRGIIEDTFKPQIEQVPGAGDVEVAGGAVREIHVAVDPERAALLGLPFQAVARRIAEQTIRLPAGRVEGRNRDYLVTLDGTMDDLESLRELILFSGPGRILRLADLASVEFGNRRPDTVSRVEGSERVVTYVQTNGTENLVSLSRDLRRVVAGYSHPDIDLSILVDSGRDVARELRALVEAVAIAMGIVAVFLALFLGDGKRAALVAFTIPVVLLVTLATTSILSVAVDRFVLAGFAIAIGSVVDVGIILTDHIRRAMGGGVRTIVGTLVSSVATSVLVVLPLWTIRNEVQGLGQITIAIVVLLLSSLIVPLVFLPRLTPVARTRAKASAPRTGRSVRRTLLRAYYALYRGVTRKPGVILAVAGLTVAGAAFLLVRAGTSFEAPFDSEYIFGHVEFESGASVASVDRRLSRYALELQQSPVISNTETLARRGNGTITVRFDPQQTTSGEVRALMKRVGDGIAGGFVFLPSGSVESGIRLDLRLTGDDIDTLKETARRFARMVSTDDRVRGIVFHFKDDPPAFVFTVDRKRASALGVPPTAALEHLRWTLHGPVASKWLEGNQEIDLRVFAQNAAVESRNRLTGSSLSVDGRRRDLAQLGDFTTTNDVSRIDRWNQQRSVSATVELAPMDLGEATEIIWDGVDRTALPAGYAAHPDQRLSALQRQFRTLGMLFVVAVLVIYMVLASQFESFFAPIPVLCVIPVSLAFPAFALVLAGSRLTVTAIIGFVLLTGMIVNNAILVIDRARGRSTRYAIRSRLSPLLLTSATTILGVVPLWMSASGTFGTTLGLVVACGVAGSTLSALVVLPAILTLFNPRSNARRGV